MRARDGSPSPSSGGAASSRTACCGPSSAPLDLDLPLPRDDALEDLPQRRVVDHTLHATALGERDELVLDALLELRVCELDAPEALPRFRRQDLPQNLLSLGLHLFAV